MHFNSVDMLFGVHVQYSSLDGMSDSEDQFRCTGPSLSIDDWLQQIDDAELRWMDSSLFKAVLLFSCQKLQASLWITSVYPVKQPFFAFDWWGFRNEGRWTDRFEYVVNFRMYGKPL